MLNLTQAFAAKGRALQRTRSCSGHRVGISCSTLCVFLSQGRDGTRFARDWRSEDLQGSVRLMQSPQRAALRAPEQRSGLQARAWVSLGPVLQEDGRPQRCQGRAQVSLGL